MTTGSRYNRRAIVILCRGGRTGTNSSGRGGSGPEFLIQGGGGGGYRVQVRGNFHILTSKKKLGGGG